MNDQLIAAVSAVASLTIMGVSFWIISLRLPKPEGKTENLRNFHCVHSPSLINKEFKCEGFYPLISILITEPLVFYSIIVFLSVGRDHLPYQIFADYVVSLPLLVQIFFGLLVIDISLWIRHGFVHKYFWSFHAVHHSAEEVSWITTHRLHPLDHFVMSLMNVAVLYVIGFSAEGMAAAMMIKNLNNYFVHSNVVLDYPKPWKYIFVSPNMHRWHHALEPEAHNKNFCVVFAFVDYVLGTYYVPDNALPKGYGSNQTELDDIERKTILSELWIPFKLNRPAVARHPVTSATLEAGETGIGAS
jgi:sterol desaturase/sphingolipid hydroxylase (fatty acid hydroxylase superfamily)